MSKSAKTLRDELRSLIWADMEPENLVEQHNEHFQEALAYIAENVLCEREANIDLIDFCKTLSKCGTTIIPEPPGVVRRLFTLVKEPSEDWCDPVYYDEVDWPLPEFFGKFAMARMQALPTFSETLDLGVHPSDKSQDTACGRARRGIWCKHRGNIIIAPWIQSVERVGLEWDGVKTRWNDDDPVNDTLLYRKAIMLYWHYLHEYWFGDRKMSMTIHDVSASVGRGTFDRALADMIYICEERKKVRETKHDPFYQRPCFLNPIIEQIGTPLPATGPTVLAHIGNFVSGDCTPVAQLVRNHAPSAMLAAGVGASGLDGLAYDQLVGSNYEQFLFPYSGDFGAGAESGKNAFWPAAADGDWDENGLSVFHSFFATPKNRNYYEVCLGPVHLFVLSLNASEPDGTRADGTQGVWLQSKLALSTAPWKIVLCHKTPDPMWPFKQWGASMVITGESFYRRRNLAGLPVIACGCGGGPKTTPSIGTDGVFATDQYDGVGLIVATTCTLRYSFIGLDDSVIDGIDLHRMNCFDPADEQVSTIAGQPPSTLAKCKRVFQSNGDPNGVVLGPGLAYCWDIVNSIVWKKDDGVESKYGWH